MHCLPITILGRVSAFFMQMFKLVWQGQKHKSHFVFQNRSNQNTIFIVSLFGVLRSFVFRLSVQISYDCISSSCYIGFYSSERESVSLTVI
jgi:hypothetical protein